MNFGSIQQGLFQPGAEQPAAHGGTGLVQYPQEGAFLFLATHGFRQFQIPAGIQIQFHEPAGGVVLQCTDMCKFILLQGYQGFQQCAAGHGGRIKAGKTQLFQRDAKMLGKGRFCPAAIKLTLPALIDAAAEPMKQRVVDHRIVSTLTPTQNFRRGEPAQLRCGRSGIGTGGGEKRTGGNVAKCHAKFTHISIQAGEIIVPAFFQHAAFRDCAGGDDPGNVPLHQAFGGGRILHLLTNGYLVALGNQTGNVGIHAVIGHAAHGCLFFLGLVPIPGGQGQIQLPGCHFGILVEHFVEVTQPEEQNAVLIAFLDFVVLTLHGCQFCIYGGHIMPPCQQVHRSDSKWWSR